MADANGGGDGAVPERTQQLERAESLDRMLSAVTQRGEARRLAGGVGTERTLFAEGGWRETGAQRLVAVTSARRAFAARQVGS